MHVLLRRFIPIVTSNAMYMVICSQNVCAYTVYLEIAFTDEYTDANAYV